VNVEHRLL